MTKTKKKNNINNNNNNNTSSTKTVNSTTTNKNDTKVISTASSLTITTRSEKHNDQETVTTNCEIPYREDLKSTISTLPQQQQQQQQQQNDDDDDFITTTTTTTTTTRWMNHHHNNPLHTKTRMSTSPNYRASTVRRNDTIIRLCGLYPTECGYCKGLRANTVPFIVHVEEESTGDNIAEQHPHHHHQHQEQEQSHLLEPEEAVNNRTTNTIDDATNQSIDGVPHDGSILTVTNDHRNHYEDDTTTTTEIPATTTTSTTTPPPILSSIQYSIVVEASDPNSNIMSSVILPPSIPTGSIPTNQALATTTTSTTTPYGMDSITYNIAIEYGWRRCGIQLYKPNNWLSCCPSYTIRLPVTKFQSTKQQRKLLRHIEHQLSIQQQQQQNQSTNNNNNNSNTNDSGQQQKQNANITKYCNDRSTKSDKGTTRQAPKQQQQKLEQSIVLSSRTFQRLQEQTEQSLLQYLQNLPNNASINIPTEIPPKPIFKIKTILQQQQQQQQPIARWKVITNTSICASICKQNHTLRTEMGTYIAQQLQQQLQQHQQQVQSNPNITTTAIEDGIVANSLSDNNSSGSNSPELKRHKYYNGITDTDVTNTAGSNTTSNNNSLSNDSSIIIEISTIHFHEPSGQINIELLVTIPIISLLSPVLPPNTEDESSTSINVNSESSSTIQKQESCTNTTAAAIPEDAIGMWWRKYHEKEPRNQQNSKKQAPAQSITPPPPIQGPYRIIIRTVPAHQSALDPKVHQLYWYYQTKIHNDPYPLAVSESVKSEPCGDQINGTNSTENQPEQELDVNDAPDDNEVSNADDNHVPHNWGIDFAPHGWKDQAELMLRTEYDGRYDAKQFEQIRQSYTSFYEFLVESPLATPIILPPTNIPHNPVHIISNESSDSKSAPNTEPYNNSTLKNTFVGAKPSIPEGTYHQHYILYDATGTNQILIAVGVIDILPKGLSSVYVFYDPDFSKEIFPLGKYTALQEIEYTKLIYPRPVPSTNISRHDGETPFYYMGYYIHTCGKMKYKAEYKPSQLLCPTTNQWVDTSIAQNLIDRDSPIHGCCTIYYPTNPTSSGQGTASLSRQKDNSMKHSTSVHNSNANQSDDQSSSHETKDQALDRSNDTQTNDLDRKRKLIAMKQQVDSMSASIVNRIITNNSIRMDVGFGQLCVLSNFPPPDRIQLQHHLEEYAVYAGPDISQHCIIKFA